MSKKHDIATALLGIMTAIIIWLTILSREALIGSPIKYHLFHVFVSFVKEMQRGKIGANFNGNIVLFMPMGVLVPLVSGKKKWFWTIGAGFCFSLFIEIVQLITARGCYDPDDVILNTIGTAIGFACFCWVEKLMKKSTDAECI